jgi:hypothetical protein
MFGFSKLFVIFIFIAIAVGYGTENWYNAWIVLGVFALVRIIWKLLT